MIKAYPAIFEKDEEGYFVSFPDLDGCFTEGSTLAEAVEMAEEVLGLFITSLVERGIKVNEPSDIRTIKTGENTFASIIITDLQKYADNSKAVKKTLTIPKWLNIAAEKKGINFSSVLQDALIKKLEV